jgi:uncharacterized FlaG/YvyC family protein
MGHEAIDPVHVPGQAWVSPMRMKEAGQGEKPDNDTSGHERQKPFMRDSYVQFVIDRVSKEVSVRIIDRQTGEVIRTIPPEEIMKLLYDADVRTGTLVQTRL